MVDIVEVDSDLILDDVSEVTGNDENQGLMAVQNKTDEEKRIPTTKIPTKKRYLLRKSLKKSSQTSSADDTPLSAAAVEEKDEAESSKVKPVARNRFGFSRIKKNKKVAIATDENMENTQNPIEKEENKSSDAKGELVSHVYAGPQEEENKECTPPQIQEDPEDNTMEGGEESPPKLPEKKYKLKWRRLAKSKQEASDDVEIRMQSSDDVDPTKVAYDGCTEKTDVLAGEEKRGRSKIFIKLKSFTKSSSRDEEKEEKKEEVDEEPGEAADDNQVVAEHATENESETEASCNARVDEQNNQATPAAEPEEEGDGEEKNRNMKTKTKKTKRKWKRFSWHVKNVTTGNEDDDIKHVEKEDDAELTVERETNVNDDDHSSAIIGVDDEKISDSETMKADEDTTLEKSDLTHVTLLADVDQSAVTTNPFLKQLVEDDDMKCEITVEEVEGGITSLDDNQKNERAQSSAENKEEGEKTLEFILVDRFTEKPKDESFYLTKRALRMYQKAQFTQHQCQPCCTVM
jgi:hypothetical protein